MQIGVERPPRSSRFQRTFCPSGVQRSTSPVSRETPLSSGPRQFGQSMGAAAQASPVLAAAASWAGAMEGRTNRIDIPPSRFVKSGCREQEKGRRRDRFMEWAFVGGEAGGKTRARPVATDFLGPRFMRTAAEGRTSPVNLRRVRNGSNGRVQTSSGSRSLCSGAKDNESPAQRQAAAAAFVGEQNER